MRSFNDRGEVSGLGSAMLLDYKGRRFLLTVRHVVSANESGWYLQTGIDEVHGPKLEPLGSFVYVGDFTRSTKTFRQIDFAISEVARDLNTEWQERLPTHNGEVVAGHVFSCDPWEMPEVGCIYAFAGDVKPEQHSSGAFFVESNVYPGLTYLRSDGEKHLFKLPVPHPGHDFFRGCSGAPVVDMKRRVVGLVVGAGEDEDSIVAISLSRCRYALDSYDSIKAMFAGGRGTSGGVLAL